MDNGDDPEKHSEADGALREVGRQFYNQCVYYAELFGTRPLRPLSPDEDVHENELLKRLQLAPGRVAEYKNAMGEQCGVAFRDGFEGKLQFDFMTPANMEDDDPHEGDTTDSYVVDIAGNLLAAERATTLQGFQIEYAPIAIDLEELLHKIHHDFRPSGS
jgi:hypothetical protein